MKATQVAKLLLFSTSLLSSGAAYAQVANENPDTDEAATEDNVIIVTAQKREQDANDIGISIAVIGGEQLEDLGIVDTADLAAVVPGLTYSDSGLAVPIYTLRGVGFNEQSVQATSTVGLYNDQVPVPFPIMSAGLSMDLQRVEVLKGPQGTVFGRNSTGGTINNVVNRPTDTLEGSVTVDYSRFDRLDLTGVLNLPLNDVVGLRLASRVVTSGEGWQQSVSRDDTLGEEDRFAARALLSVEPSDSVDILLSYNYWQDRSDTQVPQFLARREQNLASAGPTDSTAVRFFINETQFAPIPQFGQGNIRAADWVGGLNARTPAPVNDLANHALALTINVELTEDITLTSLTGYNSFTNNGAYDTSGWGGTPLRGIFFTRGDGAVFEPQDLIAPIVRADYDQFDVIGGTSFTNDSDIEAFSQELRLSGQTGLLNWLVGFAYSDDTVNSVTTQLIDFATQGNGYGFGLQTVVNDTVQTGENWGVFAHTEWALSDSLSLTAGLRYDSDTKTYSGCSRDNGDGDTAQLLSILRVGFVEAILNGNPPFGPGDCVMSGIVEENGTFVNRPFFGPAGDGIFTDTLEEDSVSWRLGLDYFVSDDVLVYASYSRGFKAGSFPTLTTNDVLSLSPVVQERIDAYEVGIKWTALDSMLQFNAAAFYYDYTDKQLFSKVVNELSGVANILTNVPETTVAGAEFDLTLRPADGLLFMLSATYVDTEVNDFTGYNQLGVEADFTGSDFPFAPPLQLSAFVGYEFPISNGLDAYFNADAQYSDTSFADYSIAEVIDTQVNGASVNGGNYPIILAQNGVAIGDTDVGVFPEFVLPSTLFLGLRAGIRSADGSWDVSIWGRNLTNEYQLNNVRRNSDQIIGYTSRPRTYGVTVGYNF